MGGLALTATSGIGDALSGQYYTLNSVAAVVLGEVGQEARDTDNLRLRPWVSTDKFNVVAITVQEISGREFHLARPWRHMLPPEEPEPLTEVPD